MKITTILGARPQFIKAATVSRALSTPSPIAHRPSPINEVLIHTGQHFDANMSQVFFDELEIPAPDYNLGIGGGSHGQNTGQMIEKIEEVLVRERPDWVLVYGDTDSTLAGTLAAVKLHIPVAHVEAGLRSCNRRMPEEINRVLTDHAATLLFAPTTTAIENLRKEGFRNIAQSGNLFQPSPPLQPSQHPLVVNIGDAMYDAALFYAAKAEQRSKIIQTLGLTPNNYVLATIHRAENTDDPARLSAIMSALNTVAQHMPVILPLHPRTKKMLESLPGFNLSPLTHSPSPITHSPTRPSPIASSLSPIAHGLLPIPPVGYLDMVMLEKNAAVVVTDSGGVQKEAYFHGVPCVTLRDETEWVELVEMGWNRLATPGIADIAKAVLDAVGGKGQEGAPYGDGDAVGRIKEILLAPR